MVGHCSSIVAHLWVSRDDADSAQGAQWSMDQTGDAELNTSRVSGVGSAPQYEAFADEYLEHASRGFFNAFYDRPACLDLLGDVNGARVLDVACGPGLYAEELVRRGATVVGVDQSPRMIELCRARVPSGDFRVGDLGDRLDWLSDASFDRVLFALAIEYVDDRVSALKELRRVLKPTGSLVLSRQHPTADWLDKGGGYFDTRVIEETWSKGWRLRYWLTPLESTCAEISAAGFVIERLVEPRPVGEAAQINPEEYARLHREPGFIAFRLLPSDRQ
jgi:SAM-dependent methyltransferase